MKCPKCNYEWETKSEKMYVTCPNCLLKVKQIDIPKHLNSIISYKI